MQTVEGLTTGLPISGLNARESPRGGRAHGAAFARVARVPLGASMISSRKPTCTPDRANDLRGVISPNAASGQSPGRPLAVRVVVPAIGLTAVRSGFGSSLCHPHLTHHPKRSERLWENRRGCETVLDTQRCFTAPDAWAGGDYEVKIWLGTPSDERINEALASVWESPLLEGPYSDPRKEPAAQPRVSPVEDHLYGVARIAGQQLPFASFVLREVDHDGNRRTDYLYLSLPLGALGTIYSARGVSVWRSRGRANLATRNRQVVPSTSSRSQKSFHFPARRCGFRSRDDGSRRLRSDSVLR
jgi:hypothetical protein